MLNLIDHGMTLTEAVEAPRIHQQWLPDQTAYERYGLSADTLKALAARNQPMFEKTYSVQIAAILVGGPRIAGTPAPKVDEEDVAIPPAHLFGAIDPRLPMGAAEGY